MSREPITPAADVAPAPPAAEKPAKPPRLLGLNHLKLASHDILATRDFYTTVFPFTPLPAYDHRRADGSLFAVMFRHDLKPAGTGTGSGTGTGNTLIEARHNSQQAAAQVGWDPVTWGVGTRADLDDWARWLDLKGVEHSRVLRGVKGWVLCARDPDGKIVRLYTEEEHEWGLPEEDEIWLGSLEDK
ncbi:VOC family protein [Apiospora arundinis]|uniref:VOC family protein n=1 Tax=Apiospora arundinis TaxID=335852 RepID=A0ABR2JI14_9PEZI